MEEWTVQAQMRSCSPNQALDHHSSSLRQRHFPFQSSCQGRRIQCSRQDWNSPPHGPQDNQSHYPLQIRQGLFPVPNHVRWYIHWSNPLQTSYEYDIALLRMVRPIQYKPNAIPICLPTNKDDLVGKTGSVTGWGRRAEFGQISPILREVHLPIISNAKCMQMYRMSGQNEWIPKIFMCAGTSNGGADSCEGDSGGPLVVKGKILIFVFD